MDAHRRPRCGVRGAPGRGARRLPAVQARQASPFSVRTPSAHAHLSSPTHPHPSSAHPAHPHPSSAHPAHPHPSPAHPAHPHPSPAHPAHPRFIREFCMAASAPSVLLARLQACATCKQAHRALARKHQPSEHDGPAPAVTERGCCCCCCTSWHRQPLRFRPASGARCAGRYSVVVSGPRRRSLVPAEPHPCWSRAALAAAGRRRRYSYPHRPFTSRHLHPHPSHPLTHSHPMPLFEMML